MKMDDLHVAGHFASSLNYPSLMLPSVLQMGFFGTGWWVEYLQIFNFYEMEVMTLQASSSYKLHHMHGNLLGCTHFSYIEWNLKLCYGS